jgi:hypothetical protein
VPPFVTKKAQVKTSPVAIAVFNEVPEEALKLTVKFPEAFVV